VQYSAGVMEYRSQSYMAWQPTQYLVELLKGYTNGDLKRMGADLEQFPYELTKKEKLEMKKMQSEIDYNKVNSYIEAPDEIRTRDGRPALTQEQLALLKFMQEKIKEGTVPGYSSSFIPLSRDDSIGFFPGHWNSVLLSYGYMNHISELLNLNFT
jgi:hypothetical protein